MSPLSTTTSSHLSLALSTEATTVTRQTSNKHMSVCTSVNVSQRFLIQRESNKSQLLYMQVYLYISIMMASIQTEAWQAQVGRCTDVNWDQRDVTLTSAAGIHHIYSAPFHNLPHTTATTRRHLLHSNMPHSSSSHFQSAMALMFTSAWLSGNVRPT